jgi:hypothetical protein
MPLDSAWVLPRSVIDIFCCLITELTNVSVWLFPRCDLSLDHLVLALRSAESYGRFLRRRFLVGRLFRSPGFRDREDGWNWGPRGMALVRIVESGH